MYKALLLLLSYSSMCFSMHKVSDIDLINNLNSYINKTEKGQSNAIVAYQKVIGRIVDIRNREREIQQKFENADMQKIDPKALCQLFDELDAIPEKVESLENVKNRFKSKYPWIRDYEKPYKN